jgi:malonate decarboxylase epsilon subunit
VIAFLFPGQGAQYAGMFARLARDPHAQATFDEAAAVLGYDVRLREDATAFASTVNVQLALLVAGVASARVLAAHGVVPEAVAGHSVGGFAAAVTADAMRFADALQTVRERARAMEGLFPSGYGMGVLAGLPERAVCEIAGDRVYIANVNAPSQCVLAGERALLERVLEEGRTAGARRAELLDVAVPSHCPLLEPVAERLRDVLRDVPLQNPRVTYVGSVGARVVRTAHDLRDDLAAGVANPVRWHDASTLLVEMGASLLIEAVPGHVLTDLAKAAFPQVRAVALDDAGVQSIAALARRA